LSSGGHLGSRRDTGGHATNTVRDREAPGSNPGPPTNFEFKSPILEVIRSRWGTAEAQIHGEPRHGPATFPAPSKESSARDLIGT
jgi:hypothetical protein